MDFKRRESFNRAVDEWNRNQLWWEETGNLELLHDLKRNQNMTSPQSPPNNPRNSDTKKAPILTGTRQLYSTARPTVADRKMCTVISQAPIGVRSWLITAHPSEKQRFVTVQLSCRMQQKSKVSLEATNWFNKLKANA